MLGWWVAQREGRAQGGKKGKALCWETQRAGIKENLTPIHLPLLRTITSCSTQSPQWGPEQSLEVSVRTSLGEGERVAWSDCAVGKRETWVWGQT